MSQPTITRRPGPVDSVTFGDKHRSIRVSLGLPNGAPHVQLTCCGTGFDWYDHWLGIEEFAEALLDMCKHRGHYATGTK